MSVSVHVIAFYRILIWKLLKDANKSATFDEHKNHIKCYYFLFLTWCFFIMSPSTKVSPSIRCSMWPFDWICSVEKVRNKKFATKECCVNYQKCSNALKLFSVKLHGFTYLRQGFVPESLHRSLRVAESKTWWLEQGR